MQSFWHNLQKPFLVQAPMEDITDTVFRQMLLECGRPDVFFTEFTNVDGIFSTGASHTIHRLAFSLHERPIVAQIWGSKPENYFQGVKYIRAQGFDGVDINMGCPQRDIIKKGLCGALIENRPLATKIIRATLEGAGKDFPVSIKTRIGINKPVTEDWMRFLLSFNSAAIIVHGRTVKEMSAVPAHWDEIHKAVLLRNRIGKQTLIIGNGDVKSKSEALEKAGMYRVDGVMIGRGMLEDIHIFSSYSTNITAQHRKQLLKKHIDLFQRTWGNEPNFDKHFHRLRKYIKIYIRGFEGSSHLRQRLMTASSIDDVLGILNE